MLQVLMLQATLADCQLLDLLPFSQNNLVPAKVDIVDLSRFRAAPGARLSHLSFEGGRAFPAQC